MCVCVCMCVGVVDVGVGVGAHPLNYCLFKPQRKCVATIK